ncbi:MAG: glycoside hydrolase family 15 protein [Candidatus Nomurabacteria bacterium]|nr:glycoside hydrolase family 15 protein [Candidatus Nomurabacteria bacterium]USN88038.1 MAG: glycoside hydrolase family 15 protein [Candidatus Nomurabacteria bacterium]
MARAVTIGNGNLLVGLDRRGQVRDLYYPFVGEANHVSGASGSFMHRIGVFVDGELSWLDDPEWKITVGSEEYSAIGSIFAVNDRLKIELSTKDAVHNEQNVFIRKFTVTNKADKEREVRLFFSQQFRIFESRRGDTAFYDPRVNAVIHYKGNVAFLINAFVGKKQFTDYNIGLFGIEDKEGTYFDAYDGVLEKNPIEHGSVDSVIGLTMEIVAEASEEAYYWIVCGDSIPVVHTLDEYIIEETPDHLIDSTDAYWQAWLEKEDRDLSILPPPLRTLYNRSLITMRIHADNRGGIIASSDTDMLHHGRDTYSYVWPRDGAFIASALDMVGYGDIAKRFYGFITDRIESGGYLMHKYRADGVLGSSWHPWIQDGKPNLPIQEDETASIIFALWQHYERNRDLEFIESLYNPFIEPAADFLSNYLESTTGLPQASYDLWEEKYGTSTYTAASVYGGLMAASRFALLLGKDDAARTYQAIAQRMKTAIGEVLYDDELKMFVKQVLHTDDGELVYDKTIDTSSFYGLILFDVYDVDDYRIEKSAATVMEKLQIHASSKGYIRYENDQYYKMQDAGSPNPWVITTLWMAQYFIKKAKTLEDLKAPLDILDWTCSHATNGGVLAEQMHPNTREHLSTAPLIWSHAEYVLAVDEYLKKVEELGEK